jgi:hypothetical protein
LEKENKVMHNNKIQLMAYSRPLTAAAEPQAVGL